MNQGSLTIDGLRFRYLEWGNPTADPILLLHGFSSTAVAWTGVGEALAGDYHLVALDQRGHGESEWDPQERYSDAQYAADAHTLAEHLRLGAFTLIGHSMGGSVAFTYASTYPNDVKRLVIEDSAPMPPGRTPADVPNNFASRAEVEQYVRKTTPNLSEPALQGRVDLYFRERPDGTWGYRADVAGVRRGRRGQNSDALWDHVRNVQCPTLVIRAGAEPPLVSQETAERLTRENPRIEVVTVPGAGHNIHFAHFNEFMPILRQFLSQPVAVA
ncbi:MAG: alpha/beta hydrolase [Chloroflexi bacterium]|nr:alpha/beta hydrolase [Chloroflexota bacterium]MBV9898608.1 alpha/beta hydrolase [Chloroflexota bacterium]